MNSKINILVALIFTTSLVSASVAPAVVDIARSFPPNIYPWVQETNIVQRIPRTPLVIVGPVPHLPPTIIRYPTPIYPNYVPPFSYFGGPAVYPSGVYPFVRSAPFYPNAIYPNYPFVR